MDTICPSCGQTFLISHGNVKYCSKGCYITNKATNQKKTNTKIKMFKKGFISNYNLFVELLPESGSRCITLFNILRNGFDQYAFYGTSIDKEKNEWKMVSEYFFRLVKSNDKPTLIIYKP
jgi:hypothetical protein